MRRRLTVLAWAATLVAALATLPAQYSLTVTKDRLINAHNEPQNWLLMNGDYGSLRYSRLTQIKRAARPIDYTKRDPQVSTLASRSMRWGGVLLLIFIVFHILHFTTGTVFPFASRPDSRYPGFSHTDVYGNVVSAFRNPWVTLGYVVAMLFLLLHLFHGAWSSVRTLGLSKPSRNPLHRRVSTAIALVVWLGFTVIPVAVFLGVIR